MGPGGGGVVSHRHQRWGRAAAAAGLRLGQRGALPCQGRLMRNHPDARSESACHPDTRRGFPRQGRGSPHATLGGGVGVHGPTGFPQIGRSARARASSSRSPETKPSLCKKRLGLQSRHRKSLSLFYLALPRRDCNSAHMRVCRPIGGLGRRWARGGSPAFWRYV